MAVAVKMIIALKMINAGGTVYVAATTPPARYFAASGLSARAVRWQLEHPRLAPATLADLPTDDEQTEIASKWVAQVFDLQRLCDSSSHNHLYVNCETRSRSPCWGPRFKESILSRAQLTVTPTGLPPKKNRIDFA
jgi:hypothetical protein